MPDTASDASPLDIAAYGLAHGLTPEQYHVRWQDRLTQSMAGVDIAIRREIGYARLNAPRAKAVADQVMPSDRLGAAIRRLPEGQTWVVLTDDWCGDSAFVFPVIEDAAARTSAVTLRVLPRDEHLAVMDRYLTGNARAIPKLVAIDADGREAWVWGPRTASASAFRAARVDEGMEKPAVIAALVAWYEEGGWRDVDAELAACIEGQLGG